MKRIFYFILSLAIVVIIISCSSDNDPQIRVKNNQLNKVNVNILTSGDKSISIEDIAVGQTTFYQSVPEGNIVVVNISQNESVSFLVERNSNYTIIFNPGQPPSYSLDD